MKESCDLALLSHVVFLCCDYTSIGMDLSSFFFFNMECSCEQPSLESPVPTSSGEKKHEVSVWKESVGAQGLYSGTAKSLVREMKEDLAEGRDNAQ